VRVTSWLLLVAVIALACVSTSSRARSVDLRLVHSYEASGQVHQVSPCDKCVKVLVGDPFRRADQVSVSPDPDFSIPSSAIRALVALESEDRPDLHRLLAFVDSSTQTGLERLRVSGDTRLILVSIGDHQSLGRLDATTPWQIDAGYLGTEKDVRALLGDVPPVHFLPEVALVSAPSDPASSSPRGSCGVDEDDQVAQPSGADYLWVSGTMKEGLRHGLWVYVDHRGELVQIQLFRSGCLLSRVVPYESEDDRQMKEVMRGLERWDDARPKQ
jgi:hypothetical protein